MTINEGVYEKLNTDAVAAAAACNTVASVLSDWLLLL